MMMLLVLHGFRMIHKFSVAIMFFFSIFGSFYLGFKKTNKQAMQLFLVFMWQMVMNGKKGYQILCI